VLSHVALIIAMGGDIPFDNLPIDKMGLRDVQIMISSKEDEDLKIKQGVTIEGTLDLLKKAMGKIKVNVRKDCLIAKGNLGNITLGPVLGLTGDGPDGKPGTKDDGASFDLAASLTQQHCCITGTTNLFGLKQTLKIWLKLDSAYFQYREKLWKLYMAEVEGIQRLSLKDPETMIKAEFEADLFKDIEDGVNAIVGNKTPAWMKTAFKKAFRVNSAGFSIGLSQLIKGITPELHVDVGYLGKREVVKLQYDFSDNAKSLGKLVEKCAKKVLQEITNLGGNVFAAGEKAVQKGYEFTVKAVYTVDKGRKMAAQAVSNVAKETNKALKNAAIETSKAVNKAKKETEKALKKAGEETLTAIGNLGNNMNREIANFRNKANQELGKIGQQTTNAINSIGNGANHAANQAAHHGAQAVHSVQNQAKKWGNAAINETAKVGKNIGNTMKSVGSGAVKFFRGLSDKRLKTNIIRIGSF
ncbi:hypothetical protein ACFL35_05795, partial [Candidatus Riflebacteria bacterium]